MKKLNIVLFGTHTLTLYNNFIKKKTKILGQLRTGISDFNDYLYYIETAKLDQCVYK